MRVYCNKSYLRSNFFLFAKIRIEGISLVVAMATENQHAALEHFRLSRAHRKCRTTLLVVISSDYFVLINVVCCVGRVEIEIEI